MILAAVDGSSLANPGPSGWAWYIDQSRWAAGGWAKATNNQGELMSVLDLLRATAGSDEPLRILSDSQYVINCCTRWIPAWKKRGWRKADNKPVLNLDLLTQIDEALAGRKVSFQWVKGHAGHPLNEKADELARAAATAYQQGTPVLSGPGFTLTAFDTPRQPDHPTPPNQPSQPEPIQPDPSPDLIEAALVVDLTEATRELLSDETQLDRARLGELLHLDYVAHLPDGLIRTRGSVLARPATLLGLVQLDLLGVDRLGADHRLLRFKLRQNSQDFLCAILWQRDASAWRARFLQQTAITA